MSLKRNLHPEIWMKLNKKVAQKMSKIRPNGAIFMLDSKEDIQRKIRKAWCPQNEIVENPVLEILQIHFI